MSRGSASTPTSKTLRTSPLPAASATVAPAASASGDRVVIKGLGLYFEGQGRPATLIAICGTAILTLAICVALLAGPATVVGMLSHWLGQ